jgi:hypothetical protein
MRDYPKRDKHGCHWIEKDPRDPTWEFCNKPVALPSSQFPWCDEHAARVYQKGTRVRDIEGLARVYK